MAKDILLDADGDLLIQNGDFVIDNSLLQEIELLIGLTKGDLKLDPMLGPDLMKFEKGTYDLADVEKALSIAFERDGKNFNEIKKQLQINVSNR